MNEAGWEDTVLWNPYGNEGMGYNNFVCVESVKVSPYVSCDFPRQPQSPDQKLSFHVVRPCNIGCGCFVGRGSCVEAGVALRICFHLTDQ